MLVQAGQTVALHRPIPVAGSLRATSTLAGIEDKGSGALVTMTTDSVDARSREPLLTTTTSLFVRGEGGFGGARTSTPRQTPLHRSPDHVVIDATRPGQALLYRLVDDAAASAAFTTTTQRGTTVISDGVRRAHSPAEERPRALPSTGRRVAWQCTVTFRCLAPTVSTSMQPP